MKNVPLDRPAYQFFRNWLRETQIIWRDVVDSAIIPIWGEAICNEDVLFNGRTPGQIAWATLAEFYPGLNLRWREDELKLLDYKPPRYYQAPFEGECFVLDIKSAYQQFYQYLYLHSDFPRKRLKYPLYDVAQALKANKLARNAVVGVARSTKNKWVKGEKTWYVAKRNRYLSPTLWAQLMSLLGEVAQTMLQLGSIHINTDGYIFSNRSNWISAQTYLEDKCIEFSANSGYGSIVGICGVFIPGVKEPIEYQVSKPVFQLEKGDSLWLEWWLKLASEKRGVIQ